jgi:hypothetical protein
MRPIKKRCFSRYFFFFSGLAAFSGSAAASAISGAAATSAVSG